MTHVIDRRKAPTVVAAMPAAMALSVFHHPGKSSWLARARSALDGLLEHGCRRTIQLET
jgi:hypothetical protein